MSKRTLSIVTATLAASAIAASGIVAVSADAVLAAPTTYLADTLSDDPTDGYTLREAIADADANPGADIVGFVAGLTGTVVLDGTQLSINDSVTIRGPMGGGIAISGDGSSRIIHSFTPGVDLTIEHLELTDGSAAFLGGALAFYQGNDLRLDHVTVSNSTTANDGGGGVSVGEITGRVDIVDSIFRGNTAMAGSGGGLLVRDHDDGAGVLIVDSVFEDNHALTGFGGGLYVNASTSSAAAQRVTVSQNSAPTRDGGGLVFLGSYTELSDTTIRDNQADDEFGGLFMRSSEANANVSGTTISGNTSAEAGAGSIESVGSFVNLAGSEVTGNAAGILGGLRLSGHEGVNTRGTTIADNAATIAVAGLSVENTPLFTMERSTIDGNTAPERAGLTISGVDSSTVSRSTISNNRSTIGDGGGITVSGVAPDTLFVSLSTISGNEAGGDGGGVLADSVDVTAFSSTIVDNVAAGQGGGMASDGTAEFTIDHTILRGNAAPLFPETTGPLAASWSIVGDTTGVPLLGGGDNLGDVDPLLGPLADNGGGTRTHRPLAGSPAIDSGDPALAVVVGEGDQRDLPRPVDVVDIGSVEVATPAASIWVPVAPSRFVDTRAAGVTVDGDDQATGRMSAGSQRRITIAGRGEVPADARGVLANVTAVRPSTNGYVTVHPCVEPAPTTASLNYTTGINLGNEVMIGLDAGDLCIFTSSEIDVTVDVVGYIPGDSAYQPVEPQRLLDTRPGGVTVDGQAAGVGSPGDAGVVTLQVSGRGPIPVGTDTVVLYVAAVRPTATGFVTVWDCDADRPLASSLNFVAGVNRGNEIVATVGHDGEVCLFVERDADLTVDVVGYVTDGVSTNFLPLAVPSRILDTRAIGETIDGLFAGGGKRAAGQTLSLDVGGRAGMPNTPASVTVNLTAVQPEAVGYVTAYPCGGEEPNAASLNFVPGANGGNEIVASPNEDGELCLFTSAAVHLTADLTGYTFT
ncbi:MAG: choice-of-anchor Q domain-containing protein [Ilumatobacter sp.]|uniref:choice-of-anchor Q domain-containing protein n=1 Tax=Ilumatobacter sp. TaxID=1967498 RepID=UPI00391BD03E